MATLVGQSLGRYQLQASLGKGGMAEVFRATDERLGREVAVKVILPSFLERPEFLDRFLREARVVAGLEHPNIVPVYDFGEQDGVPYLVMPYLDGGTLVDRLRGAPLPLSTVAIWIEQLAAALDAAHERGILHRDVKPGNVLFGRNDRLMLADFGIAKMAEAGTRLTETGVVIGTPVYMAPEIVQGGSASPASDLYALGVIAYELLTGRPPFRGESALAVLHQHVHTPPPRPSTQGGSLPATLDPVLGSALAKNPAERPASCRAFAAALESSLATGERRAATLAMPTEVGQRPTVAMQPTAATLVSHEPRPVGARLFVALALVALSVSGWLLFAKMRRLPPPPPDLASAPAPAASSAPTALGEGATDEAAGAADHATDARPAQSPVGMQVRPDPALAPAVPAPPGGPRAGDEEAAASATAPPVDDAVPQSPVSGTGRFGRGGVGTRPGAARAELPRPGMTRLGEADFQRMLGSAGRGGRLGDQRSEALHTYAEGGLAYLAGKDAVAAQRLQEASRMTGAAALEAGPIGVLRRLAGGNYPEWAMPLAYGDGRHDASGLLESELRAHPNNLAARFGQALLAHLDGRHDQSAALADEVRSRAPANLAQRLDFFIREERSHQP